MIAANGAHREILLISITILLALWSRAPPELSQALEPVGKGLRVAISDDIVVLDVDFTDMPSVVRVSAMPVLLDLDRKNILMSREQSRSRW